MKYIQMDAEMLKSTDEEYLLGYNLNGVKMRMLNSAVSVQDAVSLKRFKKEWHSGLTVAITKISMWPHRKEKE